MTLAAVRDFIDGLVGRGAASIAVPSMDGALKPNSALDRAEVLFECAAPQDLATDGQSLFLADGAALVRIVEGRAVVVREFDEPITALACLPDCTLALALAGTEVHVFARPDDETPAASFSGAGMTSINALSPAADGALYATSGSAVHGVEEWVRDLMARGRTGCVLRLDVASRKVSKLADRLEYAFGAAATNGGALVAETWRHRLVAIGADGGRRIVLNHLPSYPSRLTAASGGGWWMTAFACRTQLVEFVLREPEFRRRMMAEIDPDHWIAPRLVSSRSTLEPIQGAHVTMMGVVKPWAPPRSYGLIVRLNAAAEPVFSLHSRADGENHGIVSAVEHQGFLYAVAKGPRRVLRLSCEHLAEEFGA